VVTLPMSEVSEDDLTPDWTPEHSIDPQPLDHVHQFEEKRSLLTSGSFRQSSGSIDEDKDRTSFWNSFLGFPEREINTEQFSRRIWLGIPNQWGIRAQAWPLLCPRIDQAVEFSKTLIRREELSPEIVSSTTLELERENALLRLEANPFLVDAKAIDMLVLATHCVLEKKKQCIPGSVPVAIVLLSKLKLKVNDAFKVMVTLFSLTEIWFAHNAEEMYAEILVTADFICLKEPRIAEKFNTLKLDLADFALICSTWVRTAFMDGFPLEFMARILDSVFGVGTSILSSIVFSLIAEFKDEILVQTKRDALFEMLTTIPAMIDKTRLHSIFQRISSLHLEIRSFADSSCKKDWMEYANQPGSLRFETGVGNSCVPGFDSIKVISQSGSYLTSQVSSFIRLSKF